MTTRTALAGAFALALIVTPQSQTTSPITTVQQQIDSGAVTLAYDEETGYLRSLLAALDVPVSSQSLVFSRTSFLRGFISPRNPRAVYFNDRVYVGATPGAPVIEIATVDANRGLSFFTLAQERRAHPQFQPERICLTCHDPSSTGAAHLIMRSHFTDRDGYAFQSVTAPGLIVPITDQTPFAERWGGWYVTGSHGSQRHLGNMYAPERLEALGTTLSTYAAAMDRAPGANVTDLSGRFDTRRYLTAQSDIVALMVLGHQTSLLNLMADVRHATAAGADVARAAEPLLRALLFVGEAPLTNLVAGTTTFAADFAARGPRDRRGRSLRDLDLQRRLLRYPLSYLIYSDAFDELTPPVKAYIYRRLREVLTERDRSKTFEHLSDADRMAILEILSDTKPNFAAQR